MLWNVRMQTNARDHGPIKGLMRREVDDVKAR